MSVTFEFVPQGARVSAYGLTAFRGSPAASAQSLDEAMKALAKNINDHVQNKMSSALIAAGYEILRNTLPLVPVEHGNLRASSYVIWTRSSGEPVRQFGFRGGKAPTLSDIDKLRKLEREDPMVRQEAHARCDSVPGNVFRVEVGFTAYYALPVHERTDADHEVGQAQFLLTALQSTGVRALVIQKMRRFMNSPAPAGDRYVHSYTRMPMSGPGGSEE